MILSPSNLATWGICAVATAGVIVRPFRVPEMVWAVAGAVLLLAVGLLPWRDFLAAVGEGNDVYLFLAGMMLLSEIARREGLFDWVATHAVNSARGSPARLFVLVYAVGTLVTVFLSNDATAVVLTPAVFAATKKARANPLPFLFTCALVANAASFVLPISNPANLVLYGSHIPALGAWLARFALPSVVSIAVTFFALRAVEGRYLQDICERDLPEPPLPRGGMIALCAIVLTAITLMTVSALDMPLGLPTAALGVLTLIVVMVSERSSPWLALKHVSWSILPLVAGLFIMVEALSRTGLIATLTALLRDAAAQSAEGTAIGAGAVLAFACNLLNNLPAGLIARSTIDGAHVSQHITDALLIGVDLGPNLSITGSLATILWLAAIRREGENVNGWRFLKVGAVVMPPALLLALAARVIVPF